VLLEDDQLACHVAEMTGNCCVELFAAYGVTLNSSVADFIASDEVLLSGVIGFVGPELRGTCLLVANRSPIELSSPQKKHTRDWVGELTNQLRPMPRRELSPRVFSSESGSIMIWVEVEAEPGFALGPATLDATSSEGDVLVF